MKESRRTVLSDDELLKGLSTGSDEALTQLYRRYFPMILHFVTTNSGSEDEAKDIYQEALIVLYEKVRSGSFELHCLLKTYLYSVSRRLWLKQLAYKNRFLVNDIESQATDSAAVGQMSDDLNDHEERDRQFDLMADSLDRLGEPCRTLLEDFYIRHSSMQDITEKFGYTNADNAKTQKYKCLMRLKRLFFAEYKA
ncbi:RNA polymerase sigma factor [Spirosoma utsteinense]|uniref:RNA polymerase sigma factor (Sigma-70 family) n=1 Tax=Spirosoma utsteinense TaxID=2585773 RepID=A0ABR6W072_9BACT|nr:sigma-70 family RNA polymerase sigma factor [Spirosoma utsteinense]MBC3786576.1 RNA polymerase sigma factor (sigma-70 family) [Spirosoma utsteinense]MBC3789954.1 RNA polymerase sigma factor (sigma-70 family) [Spirosoma utsteinense]